MILVRYRLMSKKKSKKMVLKILNFEESLFFTDYLDRTNDVKINTVYLYIKREINLSETMDYDSVVMNECEE